MTIESILSIRKAQKLYKTETGLVRGGMILDIKCGGVVGVKMFVPSTVTEKVKMTILKGLHPKKIKKITSLFEA